MHFRGVLYTLNYNLGTYMLPLHAHRTPPVLSKKRIEPLPYGLI